MISTEFYGGQGFGNQLWTYVVTRVIAKDRGFDFGIQSAVKFKGAGFMDADMGKFVTGITNRYVEKRIIHPVNGSDIRLHDADLSKVNDNTQIDGYMQDEQYILHRKDEIREWLKIRPEYDNREFSSDDICVINFRGGGYSFDKEFFLPKRYWKNAVAHMRTVNPNFKFIVVTDDAKTAKKFFPDFEVYHWSIGGDYAVIKNAHYLILSNSTFAWFPTWLSTDLKYCIAPIYFARHNISDGYWSLGYNLTKGWMYLDRKGNLSDYETCKREHGEYIRNHPELYVNPKPFKRSPMQLWQSSAAAFKAIRKDTSTLYALGWVLHARGFRGAVWLNDKRRLALKYGRKTARRTLDFFERTLRHVRWNIAEYKEKRSWHTPAEIAEYRKKIRIYDTFAFFNELDVLELRLEILGPYVDYFVIVEATETYSGFPKPLYFKENQERFAKWKHKIIHYVVTDAPKDEADARGRLATDKNMSALDREVLENALASPTVGRNPDGTAMAMWLKEFYIKECIKKALVGLRNDDFCFISDLDEIWNPELLIDYSSDSVFKMRQIGYMYYLNNRSNEEDWNGWTGTVGTKYKNIVPTSTVHIRTHRIMESRFVFLRNGGWHFAFQGGMKGAKRKIQEARHPWYNPEETMEDLVARNQHYRDKRWKLGVDERGLPTYLLENREKYKDSFKQPE